MNTKNILRLISWPAVLLLAATIAVRSERLPVREYTAADGLSYGSVKRILRDSRGFLWFCTQSGLSCFDGLRFFSYSEEGLPLPSTNDLLEAAPDLYWLATNGRGVWRFNPAAARVQLDAGQETQPRAGVSSERPGQKFVRYTVGDEPATNRVNAIHRDGAGRIWAATDGGLFRLDRVDGEFYRIEVGLPAHPDGILQIWAVVEDQQGSLWAGTKFGLVQIPPDGPAIGYNVQPAEGTDHIYALLVDQAGRLWAGAQTGLLVFKPNESAGALTRAGGSSPPVSGEIRRVQIVPGVDAPLPLRPGDGCFYSIPSASGLHSAIALQQDADGRIWIAGLGIGLLEFDGRQFQQYTAAQGVSDDKVVSLGEDSEGGLWLGTEKRGVMRLARNGLVNYSTADGLADPAISSIFQNKAGEMYVITSKWSINQFDGHRFRAIRLNLPRHISHVSWRSYRGCIQDHLGVWWVATGEGVYRFPKVGRVEELAIRPPDAVYTTREGLPEDDCGLLFEDVRGDIWIGAAGQIAPRSASLTRWERSTGNFRTYSEESGLRPSNTPSAFCEDAAGRLWIAFNDTGVARYSNGSFTVLGEAEGLKGRVNALFLDHAGRLWATVNYVGLMRIDDTGADRPRVIMESVQGPPRENVFGITEDSSGRLYVGTAGGVEQIDLSRGSVRRYTASDGIPDVARISFHDRDGVLWFATSRGLATLIPSADRPSLAPTAYISGLRIGGRSYPVSDMGETRISIPELGPEQNQVQVDFFGLCFKIGDALRYQYKLAGIDQDWSPPTDLRTLNLTLSPGSYNLEVRAVNSDGVVGPFPASVSFVILAPVWKRWWFAAMVLMMAALLGYRLYRYRVGRLLEFERIRTRIATDLHDDIGSSLSQVAILSEVARQQVSSSVPAAAELLSSIAGASRELVDSMSDVVWSINPRRDRLRDLLQRMRSFAGDVFAARNIEFRFEALGADHDAKLGADVRRQIFLIFKESVNNIVRHSECTEARIEIRIGALLEMTLTDNGNGFDSAQMTDGHGLASMRQRALELGARLEITTNLGQGTTTVLKVPLTGSATRRERQRL